MTEAVVDDIVAVLPPLLNALEGLGFVGRHLHPPALFGDERDRCAGRGVAGSARRHR